MLTDVPRGTCGWRARVCRRAQGLRRGPENRCGRHQAVLPACARSAGVVDQPLQSICSTWNIEAGEASSAESARPRVRIAATSGRDGAGLFAGPAVPVSQSLGTPLHALSRSHSQARARTTGSCRKRAGYVPAEDQFVAAHDRVAMSPHPVASARPVDASCMRRRVQVVKSMVPRPSGPRLVRIQSAVFGAGCERPMRRGAGPTRRLGAEVGANCRSQDWTEYGAVNWRSVDWRPAPTDRPARRSRLVRRRSVARKGCR